MTITGFILAGGQSSRMGRDKALLRVGSPAHRSLSVGGQTLLELVMQRLAPCVQRVVVIGNAHNARRLEALSNAPVLIDLAPDAGPLMGVYTGLMHTETPLSLFVSCDMPWIESRLIERLTAAAGLGTKVIASLHPCEGIQPLPLLCHASARRNVGALLDRGARSLQALLEIPRARLVRIEEPALWRAFTNVNTPADYAKLHDEIVVSF